MFLLRPLNVASYCILIGRLAPRLSALLGINTSPRRSEKEAEIHFTIQSAEQLSVAVAG